jgi:hypothetical protein
MSSPDSACSALRASLFGFFVAPRFAFGFCNKSAAAMSFRAFTSTFGANAFASSSGLT